MTTTRERIGPLLLLDGMSLAFRAFFALPDTLETTTGVVTNAVHGFSSMLVYLIRERRPSGLVVAFDAPGATFRDEILEDYKAGRAATPDLLSPQFDMIRDVLAALAIPLIELPGYEADDIIATLATEAAERKNGDGDRHRGPGQLPARARPLHPGPLQQARGDRLLVLRRGRDHRALRRASLAVRVAGVAARRPLRQPAGHSWSGGEDCRQAADDLRRPRRDLRASERADAEAPGEPVLQRARWRAATPGSSRW